MAEEKRKVELQVFKDAAAEWRWRARSPQNHETLADSGEGYGKLRDCLAGAELAGLEWDEPPEVIDPNALLDAEQLADVGGLVAQIEEERRADG